VNEQNSDRAKTTKGHRPDGDVEEAKNSSLLPPPQSEEADV
jgi:hypothetical protein